jgi:hypothetical protein
MAAKSDSQMETKSDSQMEMKSDPQMEMKSDSQMEMKSDLKMEMVTGCQGLRLDLERARVQDSVLGLEPKRGLLSEQEEEDYLVMTSDSLWDFVSEFL